MTQALASGKTSANKFDLRENNPLKTFNRVDARILAEDFQYFYETVKGYCESGNEGSTEAINQYLSVISVSNVSSYKAEFIKGLNTLISFANYLEVDPTSTADAIKLKSGKIQNFLAPDGENYCKDNSLPYKFVDNLTFRFKASLTNTNAVTIQIPNFSGLSGSTPLVAEDGSQLVAGDIEINKYYTIITTGASTTKKFLLKKEPRSASSTSQGLTYLDNPITIANNSTDANNDIDFTAGNFQFSDLSGDGVLSAMTKRLDALWTAGTNQGGLDTGSKANNTHYHCYAIKNLTSGVSDAIFSTNETTPSLPAGYTKYKYRGSVYTNASGNILPFTQKEKYFEWKDPIVEPSGTLAGTITHPITVPNVPVLANISMVGISGSGQTIANVSIAGNNATPNANAPDFYVAFYAGQWDGPGSATKLVLTTNKTIKSTTVYSSGSGTTYKLSTFGYYNLSL
jgi:hypothetical protein